jgi:hypothetical protein
MCRIKGNPGTVCALLAFVSNRGVESFDRNSIIWRMCSICSTVCTLTLALELVIITK